MILENEALVDIMLCGDAVAVTSEPSEVEVLELDVTKEADCSYAVYGGQICYTATITNDTEHTFGTGADDFSTLTFRDVLAPSLTYIADSFTYSINGGAPVPATPVYDQATNTLSFNGWPASIQPNSTITIRFCVRVGRSTSV